MPCSSSSPIPSIETVFAGGGALKRPQELIDVEMEERKFRLNREKKIYEHGLEYRQKSQLMQEEFLESARSKVI